MQSRITVLAAKLGCVAPRAAVRVGAGRAWARSPRVWNAPCVVGCAAGARTPLIAAAARSFGGVAAATPPTFSPEPAAGDVELIVTPRPAEDMVRGTYYLRDPAPGTTPLSQVFHTHIDGPSQAAVNALAAQVQAQHPDVQTQVVPIESLHLGPQATRGSMFGSTYAALPHFHEIISRDAELVRRTAAAVRKLRHLEGEDAARPIEVEELTQAVAMVQASDATPMHAEDTRAFVSALFRVWDANQSGWLTPDETDESVVPLVHSVGAGAGAPVASDMRAGVPVGCRASDYALEVRCAEAFATVCHGDEFGDDMYAQLRSVLETAAASPVPRIVIEFEETCFEYEFSPDMNPHPVFDRGYTDFALDFGRLGFVKPPVDVPAFELHHGVDLPKSVYPERPIDPVELTKATAGIGFQNGGWSVFSNHDSWLYRSNEFSNNTYENSKAALMRQAIALPMVLEELGVDHYSFTRHTATMEKMMGIWPFRHKEGASL